MRLTSLACFLFAGAHLASAAEVFPGAAPTNDYPTSARAEYVFACMKTNGETREALDQCSCSIDVIASLIPYDAYVAGETVASMIQEPGQVGGEFRGARERRLRRNTRIFRDGSKRYEAISTENARDKTFRSIFVLRRSRCAFGSICSRFLTATFSRMAR